MNTFAVECPAGLRIVARVDASSRMGTGHTMRCLTLADSLAAHGATTTFVCATLPQSLAERISSSGHHLHKIRGVEVPEQHGWESRPASAEDQAADLRATFRALGQQPPDWFIIDHYLLDERWERGATQRGARVAVIDDLATRSHCCDLLVDQTLGRSPLDYNHLVSTSCSVLTGSLYALLRPEFAARRAGALKRRRAVADSPRILVSMGGMDQGGITARILKHLLEHGGAGAIDAVYGSDGAPSLQLARALATDAPNLAIHVAPANLAPLMTTADVAIGAPGTSSWERCCLGLPTVTLVLAENQRAIAVALREAGAALVTTNAAEAAAAAVALAADPNRREIMTAAAAAIVDGNGTKRVAGALLGERARHEAPITLRRAQKCDSEEVWLWRNDPQTRRASQSGAPVPWREHQAWWETSLATSDHHLLIAECGDNSCAIVRFHRNEPPAGGYEVSINLRPDIRGGGRGAAILKAACEAFIAERRPNILIATIRRDNVASREIFEKLGFCREGPSRQGRFFDRYVLSLRSQGKPDPERSES